MIAVEVWINGDKKCVAGTNGNVLTAIVNASRHPHVSVGGLVEKEGTSCHARWLNLTRIQPGDETRIRLIETEEVDAPIDETRMTTQAEQDEEVRVPLISARAMLPALPQESNTVTLALLDERLEQQNFTAAMHLLAELGDLNAMSAPYWKQLGESAGGLHRYEDASQYREQEVKLTPKDEKPTRPDKAERKQSASMPALEVWINGDKKCVVGNNGHVLTAIVNAMRQPDISVGGMMDKEDSSFHVQWLRDPIQIGDEVRIRLIETDEVDPPKAETRYQTQAEQDEEVRSRLMSARSMLPSSPQEDNRATIALLDERLKQQNVVAALQLLSDLGELTEVPATYWKQLAWTAQILSRYEERNRYNARAAALKPKDEPPPNVAPDEA